MSENTWTMDGLEWDNPLRIRTWQELINWENHAATGSYMRL